MSEITWHEAKKPLRELRDYQYNPRQIDDAAFKRLVDSLKQDGYHTRIKVNLDGVIIGGHARKRALLAAGFKEDDLIEVLLPDHMLTAEEFDRINIRDNLNYGVFDQNLLAKHFDAEKLRQWGMEESLLKGFDKAIEISEADDEAPDVEEVPCVAKLGDIWQLGEHTLMCGDSTSQDAISKLLGNSKADMVFTDPPYNMDFTGGIHADGSKSFNAKHGAIKNDKMSKVDAAAFFDKVNTIIKDNCTGAFYVCFYRLGINDYWTSLSRVGLDVRSLIIWHKGNHTLSNSDYMSMYEPIFYGWVKDHNFYGGNNGRDIWEIKRTGKNDLHPTMKPIELCLKAITESTKVGDSVLDIFGGSGSTLIACEKAKRKCFAIELEPKYVDVIIARWEKLTGQKASLSY